MKYTFISINEIWRLQSGSYLLPWVIADRIARALCNSSANEKLQQKYEGTK